jgi:ABC-type transport system substrate-binding protein
MKIWLKCCTALLIALPLMLLSPIQAQDSGNLRQQTGRGVVTFAADSYYGDTQTLFPNTCGTRLCAMLHALLYPRLFDIDPATGALIDATRSDRALVQAIPQDLPADEVQLALNQDRLWSDGEPVTAYDVLFSLLAYTEASGHPNAAALRELAGARVVDEHTIALRFAATDDEIAELPPDADPPTATCDDLPRSNVFILPSHYLSPSFRTFVDQAAPESLSLSAWRRAYNDARLISPSAVPEEPVTSGSYMWAGLDSDLSARFTPSDGTGSALKQTLN